VQEITLIFDAIRTGKPGAAENLLPLVYNELRRMAAYKLSKEQNAHTIQATMLVHDAWLRLSADAGDVFESRAHFFSAAAEAMRRILVDSALRRRTVKRGGEAEHVDIEGMEIVAPCGTDDELLAVHDSLDRFAAADPQKASLVKLRYFAGISIGEAAALLNISVPTANRHWAYARAWLHQDILKAR
jgi:RNA polymerase sigma factor (TIGR02999 family)